MRCFLLGSTLLLACQTHTIPITSMPAYAENRPVLTREGYALTLQDGGRAELLPRKGICLKRLGYTPTFGGAIAVGAADGLGCDKVIVPDVEQVIAGERLVIRGRAQIVEVDPQLIEAVRIGRPDLGPTYFAPETGVRNAGLVFGGSVVMAVGVACSIAMFTAVANIEGDGFNAIGRVLLGTYGGIVLASGVGGGIPMIVLGARQVRLPQAEQPSPPGLRLGSGIGIGWALE